ncbi:MAG: WYL domain-containing protein [Anaerovoracaceae bacterium]
MSKNKQSLIFLTEILKTTDENHSITANKIAEIMSSKYGIPVERRSIGRDIRLLRDNGMDIVFCPDNKRGCYLATREFENWELKVLIDAVNQAKFLKKSVSDSIVNRLLNQTSEAYKADLRATTPKRMQIKTKNKTTQNNIDTLLSAISQNKRVSFQYCHLDSTLKLVPRKEGRRYIVSPYSLIWNNDIYYLICNHNGYDNLSYYRLDKMKYINQLEQDSVSKKELLGPTFENKIAEFIDGSIHSFGGTNKIHLKLEVKAQMLDHLYDEFGESLIFAKTIENSTDYIAIINTSENQGLYYLLLQYGTSIKVLEPQNVKEEYLRLVHEILAKY